MRDDQDQSLRPYRVYLESTYADLASKAEIEWGKPWSVPVAELGFVNDAFLVDSIRELRFYLLKRLG